MDLGVTGWQDKEHKRLRNGKQYAGVKKTKFDPLINNGALKLLMVGIHPRRFGVRIVLLYLFACRQRRLKGGVRGSLVVTFASARCPWFYPGQGRNLDF